MDNQTITETNRSVKTILKTGVVRAVENRRYLVEAEGCLRSTERAVGCLVEPALCDTVLLCIDTDGIWYILSVLRRESAGPVIMPFEHGVSVQVDEGAFAVETADMRVTAAGKLSLSGDELAMQAREGEVQIGKLSYVGVALVSCLDTVRLTARCIDSVTERLVQRISRCYRTVEEFEESRIGRLRLLIREKFFLASKDAHIRAEEVVKVNGEKILLG